MLTANVGLTYEREKNSSLVLFCISFFIPLLLFSSYSVTFPVYVHTPKRQFSERGHPFIFEGPVCDIYEKLLS